MRRRTIEWTFKSFWGVFGWMGVWLDSRFYYVLGLWMGVPAAAALVARLSKRLAGRGASHGCQSRAPSSWPSPSS